MREMVIVSGKGGTGKTSLTAAFAVLAGNAVIADCDVDAADLELLLTPTVRERHLFRAGHEAVIRPAACLHCGYCQALCRFDAIREVDGLPVVDPTACEGCGVCVHFCAVKAIDFPERLCGECFQSDSRCGPLIHARLGVAAENSGKLVSIVRQAAREAAAAIGRELVLVDGPPGIGCPVIAAMTGAQAVLAVTEPTVAGEHDLERVLRLAAHFAIPAFVCVNKWDLNPEMTARIEAAAVAVGARLAGRVRYDRGVTTAQLEARTLIETDNPAAADVRQVWKCLAGDGA